MKFNKHFSILLITLFIFNFLSINPTSAQPNPPPEKPDLALLQEYVQKAFPESGEDSKTSLAPEALYSPTLYPYRLAKADPDECFNGVGQPGNGVQVGRLQILIETMISYGGRGGVPGLLFGHRRAADV